MENRKSRQEQVKKLHQENRLGVLPEPRGGSIAWSF